MQRCEAFFATENAGKTMVAEVVRLRSLPRAPEFSRIRLRKCFTALPAMRLPCRSFVGLLAIMAVTAMPLRADTVELENLRMGHVRQGYRAPGDEVLPNIAYVTIQELATRVSHRNTGRQSGCPLADQLLARIATDENLHMVFYRRLAKRPSTSRPRR